jgi:DNA repair exonuclease SbcCD ATPase subunit
VILYILAVLALAAIVFAFLSAKTWHWGYVLVVVGIFFSTLGYFILAAEVLRINAVLRKQVNDLETRLTTVTAQNDALERGSEDASIINQLRSAEVRIGEEDESIPSLAQLEHELLLAARERGRVWWNVTPVRVDAQGVQISVERPVPAGIKPEEGETVVSLFEVGEPALPAEGQPRGAQYLGQFRVTAASGQTATLQPVLPLDDFERQRLTASRGPWIMYDTMPADRYKIFAEMSEEELRQKMPPQSVEEYIRHGKEARTDDDPLRQAGFDETGKRLPPDALSTAAKKLYQRRLRDYSVEFDELARRRLVLAVDIEAGKKDLERLQAALTSAQQLQAFREDEIKRLQVDLAGATRDKQAIEQHLAKLKQQLERGNQLLAETLERNRELVRQLSARQTGSSGPASPAQPAGPLALGNVN